MLEEETNNREELNAPEAGVKYGYLHKLYVENDSEHSWTIYVRMDTKDVLGTISVTNTVEERQAWIKSLFTHVLNFICYYEGFHAGEYWGEITPLRSIVLFKYVQNENFGAIVSPRIYSGTSTQSATVKDPNILFRGSITDILVE